MEDKIVLDHGSYYIKYGFAGYNKPVGKIRSLIEENNLISSGIIIDYQKMIYIWDDIFDKKLKIKPKNCYLFISEPIFHGKLNREKIKEIMLKRYNFKGIQFTNQQILALYGSGRNNGLVIDIGYESTKIVPIYDSYIIDRGIKISPISKKIFEIYKEIDPLEIINNPGLVGLECETIGESIINSIELSPIDIRKVLFQNLVVIGGGSMVSGIGQQILKSIRNKKTIPFNLKISSPKNRDILSWVGGSIFSSLPTFINSWMK